MKGIILHGGHGTRLRPLTHTGPKQLLPIANKPMSQYCVESLIDAGITEIAIIIGGIGANKVIDYYGNGEKFNVKITYIQQDEPKGIAHAINLCKNFIGDEKFLVFLGDNIIQKSIKDFVNEFKNSDAEASILLCEVDNPTQFGIADIKNKQIIKILEKPEIPPTNLAVTGIYLLTPKIFKIIDNLKPSWRNELEITDALDSLLQQKFKIIYHMITDYWKDTGTPNDILNANGTILENMTPFFHGSEFGQNKISGNVMVGDKTIIKNNCIIKGPVFIGSNCILDGVTIGPNTSIGDNSELSECKITNSIVMSNCNISGSMKIHNSIIAYNSSITSNQNINKQIFLLGEGTKISI